MNHDEKFEQQRWEFRRRDDDDDGDSSSDDDSKFNNSNGEPLNKKPKLITDLVIHQNDEMSDTPVLQQHDKLNPAETTLKKQSKKIISRKKNFVKNSTSKKCSVVKEKTEVRIRNLNAEELEMFEDLKTFAGSLIDELKGACENMFAEMKEETRKLVAYRSVLGSKKKKIERSQKNKVYSGNKIESTVKPQKGLKERKMKSNMEPDASKFSKADVKKRTNEPRDCGAKETHMDLAANAHEQVIVSSPYLTLPTVVPKPRPQSHRNSIPLNYPEIETGKLMDAKNNYNGIQAFRPELYGSFPCKNVGFLGQNCSPMTSTGFGFPVNNLHQGLESGSNLNYDSTMSSLTYSGSTFGDNSRVDQRMNLRFPGLSEAILPNSNNSLSNNLNHKTGGEFVSLRSQNSKDGQFKPNFQRKW